MRVSRMQQSQSRFEILKIEYILFEYDRLYRGDIEKPAEKKDVKFRVTLLYINSQSLKTLSVNCFRLL